MTALSESVKARVEPELREQLLAECKRQDRSESALVRRYVRQGLARDANAREHSRRV